jgi:PAS domain S-box-containing protein
MNLASFLELAQNAALLLALALIFELAAARRQRAVSTLSGIVAGIALGLIGIVIMCTPWFLEPGIRFDMRTVLVSLSGLFFGWLPSVIVMASLAAFRWYLGGVGSGTAMAIILLSGVLGLAWRRLRRHRLAEISFREGFLFGLIVHALALLSMLTLPWETALRVLSSITLPFLTVHPLATALLGTLMAGRLQREETLARLRESEDRYRSLFENSMDAILLTVTDGHILDANPAACRMFGRAREDILAVGRSGLVDTTDPRLAALLEERERSGTASGRLSHFRKDGTRFTAELTTSLFPDTEGKMKTSMILRDITEREKTEKALQESERLFRTLTENTPDIVARFDRNLRHVYINP